MKSRIKSLLSYFTTFEKLLWSFSVIFILISFILFDRSNYLSLLSSLLGVTSLVLCAKGNPAGNLLMVIFSIIYTYISFTFAYYGEMITYFCMTAPMAAIAFITWIRNPYKGKKSEVTVRSIKPLDVMIMLVLSAVVTLIFYFILKALGTANLLMSTVSVTTSFAAVYLTALRSPYFALAYALNDVVLIVLWTLATFSNISYVSVVICFLVFLVNDLYGFFSWQKMKKHQESNS